MTLWYYTSALALDSLRTDDPTDRQRVQRLTGGEAAQPAVDATGREPGDLRLSGTFADTFAAVSAAELRGLASSDGFAALPLFLDDDTLEERGYYQAEQAGGGRPVPQTLAAARYDLRLTREGTPASHKRALETTPQTVSHPFGTDEMGYVAVPATAERVEWVAPDGSARTPATPTDTVSTPGGDLDRYSLAQAPYSITGDTGPTLVYDLALDAEGDADCLVADTRGEPKTDAEGRLQWRRGYATDFDASGELLASTRRLRLRVDRTTSPPTLSAERYSGGSWSSVALGASDWRLRDATLSGGVVGHVGPSRVALQLEFTDTTSSSVATVRATLNRGWDDVQFDEVTGTLQSGLADRLQPIASTDTLAPTTTRTLTARSSLPPL